MKRIVFLTLAIIVATMLVSAQQFIGVDLGYARPITQLNQPVVGQEKTLTPTPYNGFTDPGSLTLPAALFSLYVCAFVGGLVASLTFDGDVLCGLLCGGAVFTVIVLLSLLLPGGAAKNIGMGASIGLHAVSVLFSLFGALAASSIVKSRSRRRRKKRR